MEGPAGFVRASELDGKSNCISFSLDRGHDELRGQFFLLGAWKKRYLRCEDALAFEEILHSS
jgi:hypothetical protein